MAHVDIMTHPQQTPTANKTCLASHVSLFFVIGLAKAKLEKIVVDSPLMMKQISQLLAFVRGRQ